jgi:hypothetical protein
MGWIAALTMFARNDPAKGYFRLKAKVYNRPVEIKLRLLFHQLVQAA